MNNETIVTNPTSNGHTLAQQPAATIPLPIKVTPLAVDIPKASAMLGVSVNTIRREIARGNLHAVRIGRLYRIRTAELDAYLKRMETMQ